LIRDAHKVLIKKADELDATRKDPHKLPKKDLNEFINYTTVKSMMDDFMAPILEQLPRIKTQIQLCNQKCDVVQQQSKVTHVELNKFQ
jgi:hypothetical protein